MGLYREHVLPRLVDRACGTAELREWRQHVADGLFGAVVEIGFGSGLNVPVYPPEVTHVYAVEPATLARKLAATRVAGATARIEHIGLEGESIPLGDETCDAALSTFTLCTIPDVARALAEVHRVLKPGGRLHYLEHGLSPDAGVATWQHRIEPLQKLVAGGCHLTRDATALVQGAGFEVERVESRYAKGPKPWAWFTEGVARKAG